jgi:hypothetical protein
MNPQIVNGCQTVSSIFESIKEKNMKNKLDEVEKIYSSCFVLCKFLEISENDSAGKEFYENVVLYTNSQNKVDEKAFAVKISSFNRFKETLQKDGFVLLVKPSDKAKANNYDKNEKQMLADCAKNKVPEFIFKISKFTDVQINLETLLQVIVAIKRDAKTAKNKKSDVLRRKSEIYQDISCKLHEEFTHDTIKKIYYLYKRFDSEKNNYDAPQNPLYPMYFLGKIVSCNADDIPNISEFLDELYNDEEYFAEFYEFTKTLTKMYTDEYIGLNQAGGYNNMIKSQMDASILKKQTSIILNLQRNNYPKLYGYFEKITW